MVFIISAAIYIVCATFYVIFGSGERQPWDNPDKDDDRQEKKKAAGDVEATQSINETQH